MCIDDTSKSLAILFVLQTGGSHGILNGFHGSPAYCSAEVRPEEPLLHNQAGCVTVVPVNILYYVSWAAVCPLVNTKPV